MGGQPNPKEPFDFSQLRERTLAVLRQIPSAMGRMVAVLNPFGVVRALSATAGVMQRRFTAPLMMWLCASFFLLVGLISAVEEGMSDQTFFVLAGYVLWCIINTITHAGQRSDRTYRPIYMVMMDMSIAVGMFTLGLVLLTSVATTFVAASIWAVVSVMVVFAVLAAQFETGNISDLA